MYPLSQTIEIQIKGADQYSPVIRMAGVQGYKMSAIKRYNNSLVPDRIIKNCFI